MKHSFSAWKWIDGCTIFISIWIILSIWAGYAGILSPAVGIVSLALAWGVSRTLRYDVHEPKTKIAAMVAGIIFAGMGFIFFGIQGGFDLSADATPSVATQIITTHIPSTYTPYFDLPVFYQMGLPAIASQFSVSGVPAHSVLWLFAIVGIVLSVFGLLRAGKMINENPLFLFWIPILFLGTRLPAHVVLLGEYPWMLALGLGLLSVGLFSRSWAVGVLVLAAAGLVHPYIGLFSALVWVLFYAPPLKTILQTAAAGAILILPLILFLILPFGAYEQVSLSSVEPFTLASIVANIMLVGLIPCSLAALGVIRQYFLRVPFSMKEMLLVGLFAGSILGSTFLNAYFPELILGTKLPTLALFAAVLLSAQFLSTIIKPSHIPAGVVIVLVASGIILLTSPSMQSYVHGSKSTLDEAQFAALLYAYDSNAVPVLFLSSGAGKMAQYSQKIPSDPRGAHFMLALQLLDTSAARALKQQSDEHRALFETKCVSCVDDFLKKYPMTYVVVNTNDFPRLEKKILYERENFILYDGQ